MKKMMFALAASVAIGAFAVESANTVGYTTKTIEAGKYMMLGVQFDTTAGATMSADEAFKLDKAGKAWESADADECIANWYVDAPCLKIPRGTVDRGYTDLYYAEDAYDEENEVLTPGWATQFGYLVKAPQLLSGYGVWIKAGNEDLTVTIAGQVKATATASFSGGAGYNLMRLPYPVTLNTTDTKVDWGLTAQAAQAWESADADECITDWYKSAPCIKIPRGSVDKGYTDLYYSSNAYDEENEILTPGWATQFGYLVKNVTIPVGQGFWLQVPAAFTATQTK